MPTTSSTNGLLKPRLVLLEVTTSASAFSCAATCFLICRFISQKAIAGLSVFLQEAESRSFCVTLGPVPTPCSWSLVARIEPLKDFRPSASSGSCRHEGGRMPFSSMVFV